MPASDNASAIPTTPSLFQLLEAFPYDALRRIGSYLKVPVRGDARHQKRTWALTIASVWEDADSAAALFARLPRDATAAYHRLRRAPGLPASLFSAEFGGLRPLRHLRPPYSVAEHLFLSGLLHALQGGAPHTAARLRTVSIPLNFEPEPRLHNGLVDHDPRRLLHDLSQLLVFLTQHPDTPLQHERWVSPRALHALNQLLLAPASLDARTTHKQCDRLRTLWFLAVHAQLIDRTTVTAVGWAWAGLSPSEQLRMLWQTWLDDDASPSSRAAYHQPDAAWGAAARHCCALFLARTTAPFTALDLADMLLTDRTIPPAFYTAHFAALADLEAAMINLLETVFSGLGVVAPIDAIHYGVTPTGRWLAGAPDALQPPLAWTAGAASLAAWSSAGDMDALYLRTAWHTAPSARLVLSLFSAGLSLDQPQEPADSGEAAHFHTFLLTPTGLAAALARGLPMASLWQALSTLHLSLHSAAAIRLRQWSEAGDQVTISHVPLLRTRETAQLARLAQHSRVRPFLTEILAPTVAMWSGELGSLQVALRAAGFSARAGDVAERVAYDDPGLLWLAARLYQSLGRWLPLPAPLDEQALQRLASQLGPAQQAHLEVLALRLQEHLADLLDDLPFTPPPAPSDPEVWRSQIEETIAAGQSLDLTYFSAGRNLTTSRRVDPYWIEEHHDTPYLRAYCHSAGRVLTFRLDRIQSMERRQ
jgi:hypothetical protein